MCVCVCVCVCARGNVRRSDAVRVRPAWLQRHSCEFVTGVKLEARRRTRKDKAGENERLDFDTWPRPGEGGIYTRQVRYVGR